MTDQRRHPPGMPHCHTCDHAAALHGTDGCLVRRCNCWRTADSCSSLTLYPPDDHQTTGEHRP